MRCLNKRGTRYAYTSSPQKEKRPDTMHALPMQPKPDCVANRSIKTKTKIIMHDFRSSIFTLQSPSQPSQP